MKVAVQKLDGASAGDIELSDAVFGIEPRADILHRVVTWQLENRRGTARATRERSDVARTGKKFGRQKGGGTARHGDRAAPIFIGGGKAHGARRRDFEQSLNKKLRALGLKMALSAKARDGLVVVDSLELAEAKTKALAQTFGSNGWNGKVLVIDGEAVENGFRLAAGNLPGVNVLPAVGANVYDILKHDTLVLTRSAVEKLEARFNG
ncbi:50S ribosomal protein L4 [Croceibacterium mercuriale]|uniref:Large ribosomal subunit protein uL4 n=1 Tax=Croceibacterium mercuriale TaxID=1572751 RepID=A0A0B2C267_9SPHN|nr:50S ribosomal protein L4 [Croceibacterium mercuriale]KHL26362.1 50S ribosomal protein L4 [Croceibacterium mercuriale]